MTKAKLTSSKKRQEQYATQPLIAVPTFLGTKPIKVYVCGIAWQHEIDATDVTVWPSLKAAQANNSCAKECGVVELTITEAKWVRPQKLKLMKAEKAKEG